MDPVAVPSLRTERLTDHTAGSLRQLNTCAATKSTASFQGVHGTIAGIATPSFCPSTPAYAQARTYWPPRAAPLQYLNFDRRFRHA